MIIQRYCLLPSDGVICLICKELPCSIVSNGEIMGTTVHRALGLFNAIEYCALIGENDVAVYVVIQKKKFPLYCRTKKNKVQKSVHHKLLYVCLCVCMCILWKKTQENDDSVCHHWGRWMNRKLGGKVLFHLRKITTNFYSSNKST